MVNSVVGSTHQNKAGSLDPLKLKSKKRLRAECDEEVCGQSQKAIAVDLKTSDAQLSRILADHCADDLPAHKVAYLTRSIGPGYMEWLAMQCGGVYHHGEQAPQAHLNMTVLVGLLAKQSGATIQQLIQDLADMRWSVAERRADLPGLKKLKAYVDALILDAEGGAE